jgi:flavin-dependent dehydrogenase
MEQYDIVVVGGGPAGLSAGVKCAQNGIKTLIIEKDPIDLSKKAWITFQQAVDAWDLKDCVVGKVKGLNFNCVFGGVTVKASKYAGFAIDQSLFSREMLSKVKVDLLDSTEVTDAKRKNGKVLLKIDGKEKEEKIKTPLVIDATGSFSRVARMLGKKVSLKMGFTGYGVKLQAKEDILPYFGLDEETVGFWGGSSRNFSSGLRGYMWDGAMYPYGDGSIDICCGETGRYPSIMRKYQLKDEYEFCRNRLKKRWDFLQDFYKEGFSRGDVVKRYYGFIREDLEEKPFDDNLLMVGDNTGRVSLVTGEGFHPAVVYGKIAGDFATRAITEGKTDKNYLAEWNSILNENELTGRIWPKIVNHALRLGSDYMIAFIISCLGSFAVKFEEDELINLMSVGKLHKKDIFEYAMEMTKHLTKLTLSSGYRKEFMSGEYIRRRYPDAKIWIDPKIKKIFGL